VELHPPLSSGRAQAITRALRSGAGPNIPHEGYHWVVAAPRLAGRRIRRGRAELHEQKDRAKEAGGEEHGKPSHAPIVPRRASLERHLIIMNQRTQFCW